MIGSMIPSTTTGTMPPTCLPAMASLCTALRPQLVTESTPGVLKVIPATGVYAAIRRENGAPFSFPGCPSLVWEAADAGLGVRLGPTSP